MPSACLPLQDEYLEYLKDRACLHAQSKTIQKIMYKFEVCFNPSIEISICTGSSGVMPKSCYAGYMNKVEFPPIAPLTAHPLPAVSQKFSQGGLSVNHLCRTPNIQMSVSDVGMPYSIKLIFPRFHLIQYNYI